MVWSCLIWVSNLTIWFGHKNWTCKSSSNIALPNKWFDGNQYFLKFWQIIVCSCRTLLLRSWLRKKFSGSSYSITYLNEIHHTDSYWPADVRVLSRHWRPKARRGPATLPGPGCQTQRLWTGAGPRLWAFYKHRGGGWVLAEGLPDRWRSAGWAGIRVPVPQLHVRDFLWGWGRHAKTHAQRGWGVCVRVQWTSRLVDRVLQVPLKSSSWVSAEWAHRATAVQATGNREAKGVSDGG